MDSKNLFKLIIFLFIGLISCNSNKDQIWIIDCKVNDEESCGFKSMSGTMEIDHGKYQMIFTDTFRNYAIVLKEDVGFIGIDKKENTLFKVFTYDNGPDYEVDGFFRIEDNGKVGFVNYQTGQIVIKPQFSAAQPFESGYAAICENCNTRIEGEHSTWINGKWGLIDKKGKIVVEPQYDRILSIGANNTFTIIENESEKIIAIE